MPDLALGTVPAPPAASVVLGAAPAQPTQHSASNIVPAPTPVSAPAAQPGQPAGPKPTGQPVLYSKATSKNRLLPLSVIALGFSLITPLLLFGISVNIRNESKGLTQAIAQVDKELVNPKLQTVEKRLGDIGQKITAFQSATANRSYYGRVLSLVASRMPKNSQLTLLSFDSATGQLKIDVKTDTSENAIKLYESLRQTTEINVVQASAAEAHLPTDDEQRFIAKAYSLSLPGSQVGLIKGCQVAVRFTSDLDDVTKGTGDDAVLVSNLSSINYKPGTAKKLFTDVTYTALTPATVQAGASSAAAGSSAEVAAPSISLSLTMTPAASLLEPPAKTQADYCSASSSASPAPAAPDATSPTTGVN